ncbi:MAG: hypothetical protein KTR31_05690 [Myxococcales bacterium]|nr:hypothetical protein [Myxococcales bacterium]
MTNHARSSQPLTVLPALTSLRHLRELRLEASYVVGSPNVGIGELESLRDLASLRSIEVNLGPPSGRAAHVDQALTLVDSLPVTIEELTLSGVERVDDPLLQALERLDRLEFIDLTARQGPNLRTHGMVGLDFRDWRRQGEQMPHRRAGGLSFLSVDVDDDDIAALADQPGLRALAIRNGRSGRSEACPRSSSSSSSQPDGSASTGCHGRTARAPSTSHQRDVARSGGPRTEPELIGDD